MKNEIRIEEIRLEDYSKLKDIIRQQQLYHYDLNGPYKERFLKINEVNFQEYMMKKKVFNYICSNSGRYNNRLFIGQYKQP